MLKRLLTFMGRHKRPDSVLGEAASSDQPRLTKQQIVEIVLAKRKAAAEVQKAKIEKLKGWLDVGEEFEFLGIKMIVVRHSIPASSYSDYYDFIGISARYVNQVTGALCEISFSEAESFALAKTPNV